MLPPAIPIQSSTIHGNSIIERLIQDPLPQPKKPCIISRDFRRQSINQSIRMLFQNLKVQQHNRRREGLLELWVLHTVNRAQIQTSSVGMLTFAFSASRDVWMGVIPLARALTMFLLSSLVKGVLVSAMWVAFRMVMSSFVSAPTTARAWGRRVSSEPEKLLTAVVRPVTAVFREVIVVRSWGARSWGV